MNNKAKVSIILPTYNRTQVIKRAINSVLNQSYSNFELIIIDDGSTDNTAEVIKSFNDERIQFIRNDNNRGQAIARNIGLKRAKGSYIAFLDSDDVWHKDYLEKQIETLSNMPDEYGLVYCKCRRLNNSKITFLPPTLIKEEDIKEQLIKENFTTLQAILLKRGCLEKCGYLDERMTALEDWDFFIRLSDICRFKYNDEVLVDMYASRDGVNNNIADRIAAREHILDKNSDTFKDYPETLASHFYTLAVEYAFLKDGENAVKNIEKAVKLNPGYSKYRFSEYLLKLNFNLFVFYTKAQIKLKNLLIL